MKMGRLVFIKILGGIALLMIMSLVTAVLWMQHGPKDSSREPASLNGDGVFSDQGEIPVSEVFAKTAVSDAIRARKIVFNQFELGRILQADKPLDLELFPDKSVRIQLQNPSKYSVNDRLLVGQVAGDPESRVRLQIARDSMDGRIEGSRGDFRIVPMGDGVHWVIEIKTKNSN